MLNPTQIIGQAFSTRFAGIILLLWIKLLKVQISKRGGAIALDQFHYLGLIGLVHILNFRPLANHIWGLVWCNLSH